MISIRAPFYDNGVASRRHFTMPTFILTTRPQSVRQCAGVVWCGGSRQVVCVVSVHARVAVPCDCHVAAPSPAFMPAAQSACKSALPSPLSPCTWHLTLIGCGKSSFPREAQRKVPPLSCRRQEGRRLLPPYDIYEQERARVIEALMRGRRWQDGSRLRATL